MEVELPEWMEEDWAVRRDDGVAAVVRRDFLPAFGKLGLMDAADRPPEELAPGARPFDPGGGRGGLGAVPAGAHGEAVIRPYRRGGFPARFVERSYLLGDRAYHELEVAERLRRAGVPVPEPLAAVQSDRGRWGYRAALVTRRVTGADPAPERLEGADPGTLGRELARMGRSAGLLHGTGGIHADLNAFNFLLPRGGGEAVLLDFDRARVVGGRVPKVVAWMNLRRLRRHLEKLELTAALEAWDAFEDAYEKAAEEAADEAEEDAEA